MYYLRMRADSQPCRRALPGDQVDLAVQDDHVAQPVTDATHDVERSSTEIPGRHLAVSHLVEAHRDAGNGLR